MRTSIPPQTPPTLRSTTVAPTRPASVEAEAEKPAPAAEDERLPRRVSTGGVASPLQGSAEKLKALRSPRDPGSDTKAVPSTPSPSRGQAQQPPSEHGVPDLHGTPLTQRYRATRPETVTKHKRQTSCTIDDLRAEGTGSPHIKRARARSFQAMRSPLFRSPRTEDALPPDARSGMPSQALFASPPKGPRGPQFGGPLLPTLPEGELLAAPPPFQTSMADAAVAMPDRVDPPGLGMPGRMQDWSDGHTPAHPRPPLGFDAARKVTEIDGSALLTKLFPEASREERRELFQSDDLEFQSVSTEMCSNMDMHTGNLLREGSVSFSNFYSEKVWILASNYRDPKLAAFHLSDVIRMQAEKAGCTKGPEHLVRKMVESEDSLRFFTGHTFSHKQRMNTAQFDEFMSATVNGKSSRRLLAEMGLRAEGAQVLIYKDVAEEDDYQESEYSDEEGFEIEDVRETRWLYSVVLKTAPLTPEEAAAFQAEKAAAFKPKAPAVQAGDASTGT
jgi:hypothetical protein